MRKRNEAVYLKDILESIERIEQYIQGVKGSEFLKNLQLQDAVLKRLEIIGEAVKGVSNSIRKEYPEIPWKEIAGLRNILVHEYFGVNQKRVWKVVVEKLPLLKEQISDILKEI